MFGGWIIDGEAGMEGMVEVVVAEVEGRQLWPASLTSTVTCITRDRLVPKQDSMTMCKNNHFRFIS